MKYVRFLILFLSTALSALVGIFAGMWATIQMVNIFYFYLWVYIIIALLISAVFAFGGYKLTDKLISRSVYLCATE